MLVASRATKKMKVSRDASSIATCAAMLAVAAFWSFVTWEAEFSTTDAGLLRPSEGLGGLWYAPDAVLYEETTVANALARK
jgi:hypothetical protein